MQQFLYYPGDLIKFINGASWCLGGGIGEPEVREVALVVRRDFTDSSEPAVLITFPHASGQEYHYYDLELHEWEMSGTIEVHRAS